MISVNTLAFKYTGQKVFDDFGQMSVVLGWKILLFLSKLRYLKTTENTYLCHFESRQACYFVI